MGCSVLINSKYNVMCCTVCMPTPASQSIGVSDICICMCKCGM